MADVRIFVSCHKEFQVAKLPWLYPIHVGAGDSRLSAG